jgi:hypothetical protein
VRQSFFSQQLTVHVMTSSQLSTNQCLVNYVNCDSGGDVMHTTHAVADTCLLQSTPFVMQLVIPQLLAAAAGRGPLARRNTTAAQQAALLLLPLNPAGTGQSHSYSRLTSPAVPWAANPAAYSKCKNMHGSAYRCNKGPQLHAREDS